MCKKLDFHRLFLQFVTVSLLFYLFFYLFTYYKYHTKTSSRSAVHTLSAAVQASGQDIANFNINRSSMQRARHVRHYLMANQLKESFNPVTPLTLHFDGKLMMDLTGEEKVDRLPFNASECAVDQLLRTA
jgi:hypothetical protein